jgi:hypothetical protein
VSRTRDLTSPGAEKAILAFVSASSCSSSASFSVSEGYCLRDSIREVVDLLLNGFHSLVQQGGASELSFHLQHPQGLASESHSTCAASSVFSLTISSGERVSWWW